MYESPTKTKVGFLEGSTPQMGFVFGLVTGVAIVSLVGWFLTTSSGLSFTAKPTAATPTVTETLTPNTPAPPLANIDVKEDDYIRGNANAPVTLIEYSDLECPYCKSFHPAMEQLLQEYDGQVRWVYRHFPLSFHANAQKEAEAAECIGKLGGSDKFWQFVDTIFERTTSNGYGFALDKLPSLAAEIGVSQSQFTSCLDSGEFAAKVQNDLAEGSAYGVGGTPSTFVNGRMVEGAVPYEQLKQIVDQVLSGA